MDSIKTALVDADPENTQTSERMEINAASTGESNDTDGNGETGLRLPVTLDAMPAIQQLRRENPNQTALPTRHTNENHDSHHFHRLTTRSSSVHETASTSANWQSHRVARAVRQAAHITATESDALTLRIRNEQNLAVASTPKEELAERIRRITTLQLGGKEYQVYAYVAAPDMSCKGVALGSTVKLTRTN
ncbi:hypothetical protein HPB49_019967 [Dermacentor silvarum]|uniref:Uncharacterized protein n=1 Tax=Dermacentor silvarum TaxID=543639 RepID=A0ACB8DFF0_DERSI|nr:hypothetical protein HPB49_019967 [Dermacentor silvarum]